MTRKILYAVLVVFACLALGRAQEAAESPGPAAPPKRDFHRSGTVKVMEDSDGNVTNVVLFLYSYDLIVEDSAKDLLKHDGARVRVTGNFADKSGTRAFSVKSFELLDAKE